MENVVYKNKYISIVFNGEDGYYPLLDSRGGFITNIVVEDKEELLSIIEDFQKCENDALETIFCILRYEDFELITESIDSVRELIGDDNEYIKDEDILENEFVNVVGNKYLVLGE